MNAKLIISVVVAAFALSACHHHHHPSPPPSHNVHVSNYRPAPPSHKAGKKHRVKPKGSKKRPPRYNNGRHRR